GREGSLLDRAQMSDVTPLRYLLITPARNEEAFIEKTIQSVVSQTVRPVRWVIVNDGSTEGTASIIGRYTTLHDWIDLVTMPERRDRSFAAKVHSFKAGYEKVKALDHQGVANLDADIWFDEDFLELL